MRLRVICPQIARVGAERLRQNIGSSKEEKLLNWVRRNGGQVRHRCLVSETQLFSVSYACLAPNQAKLHA